MAVLEVARRAKHRLCRSTLPGQREGEHDRWPPAAQLRPHYYEHALEDAFAVHFCGAGDKMLRAAEFARRFGLGQELVEEVLLTRWSTRSRERMSALQRYRRKISELVVEIRARLDRKIRFIRETGTWK